MSITCRRFVTCRSLWLCLVFLIVPARLTAQSPLSEIKHFIIIYQENWSFDSLYGYFPGADGFAKAGDHIPQVDKLTGQPLTQLPQPLNSGQPDTRFPPGNGHDPLPVQPYDLSQYVSPEQLTGDIVHRFWHEQAQIDGGKMDMFVTWSDNGGLVYSYFDATNLPE